MTDLLTLVACLFAVSLAVPSKPSGLSAPRPCQPQAVITLISVFLHVYPAPDFSVLGSLILEHTVKGQIAVADLAL